MPWSCGARVRRTRRLDLCGSTPMGHAGAIAPHSRSDCCVGLGETSQTPTWPYKGQMRMHVAPLLCSRDMCAVLNELIITERSSCHSIVQSPRHPLVQQIPAFRHYHTLACRALHHRRLQVLSCLAQHAATSTSAGCDHRLHAVIGVLCSCALRSSSNQLQRHRACRRCWHPTAVDWQAPAIVPPAPRVFASSPRGEAIIRQRSGSCRQHR